MDEWSKFAERNGIDIVKVINAVRVRPTHSNLIFPGPGIGGYCLPKDGVLDDRKIKGYLQLGCEVKGLGRGHIRRIKDEIRNAN